MSKSHIHFGSLEHEERLRIEAARKEQGGSAAGGAALGQAALAQAVKAGNINIGTSGNETLALSERTQAAQEKHAKLRQRVEAERRARSIVVPTAPADVKAKLRSLGHPITLFGEKPGDRRERLRELMAKMEVEGEEARDVLLEEVDVLLWMDG